jgi:hypothetical protein
VTLPASLLTPDVHRDGAVPRGARCALGTQVAQPVSPETVVLSARIFGSSPIVSKA